MAVLISPLIFLERLTIATDRTVRYVGFVYLLTIPPSATDSAIEIPEATSSSFFVLVLDPLHWKSNLKADNTCPIRKNDNPLSITIADGSQFLWVPQDTFWGTFFGYVDA